MGVELVAALSPLGLAVAEVQTVAAGGALVVGEESALPRAVGTRILVGCDL